ncbi:MAG: roadblock/LC7 domain-containing protein [Deltaproteobacteria bacterium]|nr:roadblock/LC7 domain-containing protein [Deltaproteobacteria bacterium]
MTQDNNAAARAELAAILDSLVSECALRTVALVTRDGSLVTSRGDVSYLDITALAALLGGMFSATREVAKLVGEKHFSILLQQGEKRHIHISLVTNDFMLALIFEDVGKIGMIRTVTRRIAGRVGELAAMDWTPSADEPASQEPAKRSSEFREYALDLIDRIFSP